MAQTKLYSHDEWPETEIGRHCSNWTIYRLIREGEIEAVRIGRKVYLTDAAIEAFIARGGVQGNKAVAS